MKKFLKLTTMLLAAALVSLTLSGCKTDPDKLYGTWESAKSYTDYFSSIRNPASEKFFNGAGPDYEFKIDAEEYANIEDPGFSSQSEFFSYVFQTTKLSNKVYGFKATVTPSPEGIPAGFIFHISATTTSQGDSFSYYTLFIQEDGFLLTYRPYSGSSQIVAEWTTSTAIKPNQKNTIAVYSDKNGKTCININSKKVYTIEEPARKAGACGIIGPVTYQTYTNQTPVNIKYNFTEFQTSVK